MTTNHIPQLADALQHGNLVLFVGADLPQATTGRPSRAELAAGLAQRLGLSGPPPPWPEVAARYEASAGRFALVRWLKDQLDPTGKSIGPIYGLLAQLPVTTYITSAYDTWLYDALPKAGRPPNLPVVGADSLSLQEADQPTVVYLFGVRDRPESLVLTAADLRRLPQTKIQIMAGLVQPTLANKTVLILGQDLRDTYFQTIYQTALFQASTIRPPAYAVWPGLADWEKQTWLRQEVRVVEMPVLELLADLAGGCTTPPALAAPAAPPVAAPSGRLHVDPDHPPVAAIRELLTAAFTPQDLHRFCYDRPAFRPVVDRISPDHGLDDMVDRVLVHCEKKLLWDELLAEVAEENPAQYARFKPRLGG